MKLELLNKFLHIFLNINIVTTMTKNNLLEKEEPLKLELLNKFLHIFLNINIVTNMTKNNLVEKEEP